MRRFAGIALAVAVAAALAAADTLEIEVIDVEGGQATLIVSPARESVLIDAGWAGFEGRDADRIAAAVKRAGLSHIDYLIVTHYHRDHVGGVPELIKRVPVRTFVDHGPTVEADDDAVALYDAYVEARRTGRHLQVAPGDAIPVKGIDVRVVAANGRRLQTPPGSASNPLCGGFRSKQKDLGENARSVGVVISFGSFRMLDLGDLMWNEEGALVCPDNALGLVDVYLTTHHGLDSSNPPVLVHAVRPRVAVMNNGAKKGGSKDAWRVIRTAPRLLDFWQLHYTVDAGAEHNSPEPFIANLDETTAHGIHLSASRDGGFTVTNGRTRQSKHYPPAGR
jgi:beta-lactamase superfamily II metal-dependent hydrolase